MIGLVRLPNNEYNGLAFETKNETLGSPLRDVAFLAVD